jgi:hypothetical protein
MMMKKLIAQRMLMEICSYSQTTFITALNGNPGSLLRPDRISWAARGWKKYHPLAASLY